MDIEGVRLRPRHVLSHLNCERWMSPTSHTTSIQVQAKGPHAWCASPQGLASRENRSFHLYLYSLKFFKYLYISDKDSCLASLLPTKPSEHTTHVPSSAWYPQLRALSKKPIALSKDQADQATSNFIQPYWSTWRPCGRLDGYRPKPTQFATEDMV